MLIVENINANNMIDLTKILKKGDKVYALIADRELKIADIDLSDTDFPIRIGGLGHAKGTIRKYTRSGALLKEGKDCLLFPSKEEQSWENFSPFKRGDLVLVYDGEDSDKVIGIFSHKADGLNYIFKNLLPDGSYEYTGFKNCEYHYFENPAK